MAEEVETDRMSSGNGISHNSSFRAFRSKITDKTVRTTAKETRNVTSEDLASLPDEHHSVENIKTEMELVVLL